MFDLRLTGHNNILGQKWFYCYTYFLTITNNVPNGNPDFKGSFTLRVTGPETAPPKPVSIMLLGGGLVTPLAASRRLRRA